MTHLPPPVPQPLPAQSIAYRDDADVAGPWVRYVRIVAAIGLVVASASLAQVVLAFMPVLGLPNLLPAGIRWTLPRVLMAVPAGLLLAGSIACLSLRPVARPLMIAYGVAALVMVGLNFAFTASQMLGGGIGTGGGARGYVLLSLLSTANGAAFPVAVLALLRQAPVQRIFGRQ